MIPVRQTRFSTETFGNCYEAALASILELPLSAVPDRLDYIDADAWADLVQRVRREGGAKAVSALDQPESLVDHVKAERAWLAERGLTPQRFEPTRGFREADFLNVPASAGYWIGDFQASEECAHAVVMLGAALAHDPLGRVRRRSDLGKWLQATVLIAIDPAKVARRLGPELLPDVAGVLERYGPDVIRLDRQDPGHGPAAASSGARSAAGASL